MNLTNHYCSVEKDIYILITYNKETMLGYGFHSDYYILYNPGGQIIFKGLKS